MAIILSPLSTRSNYRYKVKSLLREIALCSLLEQNYELRHTSALTTEAGLMAGVVYHRYCHGSVQGCQVYITQHLYTGVIHINASNIYNINISYIH